MFEKLKIRHFDKMSLEEKTIIILSYVSLGAVVFLLFEPALFLFLYVWAIVFSPFAFFRFAIGVALLWLVFLLFGESKKIREKYDKEGSA